MAAEHRIRLRAAWTCGPVAAGDAGRRRIDLPAAWPADLGTPTLLARPFGRPPIGPGRASLALLLEAVAGLREVRLNGRVLARPPEGTEALEIPLDGPLPRRNLLELEADPSGRADAANPEELWGFVSLIVRGA